MNNDSSGRTGKVSDSIYIPVLVNYYRDDGKTVYRERTVLRVETIDEYYNASQKYKAAFTKWLASIIHPSAVIVYIEESAEISESEAKLSGYYELWQPARPR